MSNFWTDRPLGKSRARQLVALARILNPESQTGVIAGMVVDCLLPFPQAGLHYNELFRRVARGSKHTFAAAVEKLVKAEILEKEDTRIMLGRERSVTVYRISREFVDVLRSYHDLLYSGQVY